ncbi:peptidase domain-containing ABC transporter [Dysgonomonas capnocytophagoides]|uniref:peptidase domain-containing ABC transporter n=1 Tax=Dysgonomonas capnocytophagoides TaxID=45254 RepID=UPI003341B989
MKFPIIYQLESNDCGPVCIQIISEYYGHKYSLRNLKDISNIGRQGTSSLDLVHCLKNIGFKAAAIFVSLDELHKMPLPTILYWRQEHYVVLYEIKNLRGENYYYISDPAYGRIKLNESEFLKCWLNQDRGVAILIQPSEKFDELKPEKEEVLKPISRISKLFASILQRHKKSITLSSVLILISIILSWAMPVILQKVIDEGVLMQNISVVWKLMFFQFCFFCGYTISDMLSSVILMKVNFNESIKYLVEYLYKLVRLPIKFFDTRLNTDLIKRMEDQERIQSFLTHRFIELFFMILNLIIFSSILFYYNGISFLIFFILSAVSISWTILFLKKRKRLDYDRFSVSSQNNNNIYEMINGMSEIKINNAENIKILKWENLQSKINRINLKSLYLNYYQLVGSSFVNRLRDIIITCICAYFVINDNITLGTMMTISYILGQLSSPVSYLTNFTQTFQDVSNSLERLDDIQSREDEDVNRKIYPPDRIEKGFSLKNASFKYLDNATNYVIDNLSLEIPSGKITAIVGVSGSGKTTLMKLLLSFYYPQKGDIFLDDYKLNEIKSDEWRKKCGVVMQDGIIFSGTIAENIALSDDKPEMNKVKLSAKMACVDDFIERLPLKYGTKIGRIGIDLSGGQKQRILIARAIYKNPQIIFLDEATSSLDANNEMAILNNLSSFFQGKTVIVIAHRLSTVKNADNIVVINNGQIVEQGTHEKLSLTKGLYYELVKNQLELGN